ncbi:MAG: hypothetical protein LBN04_10890 [Oscillospiraceae bacterium]|nr:hypothetical protein [Oscillospiraceae bacterium]
MASYTGFCLLHTGKEDAHAARSNSSTGISSASNCVFLHGYPAGKRGIFVFGRTTPLCLAASSFGKRRLYHTQARGISYDGGGVTMKGPLTALFLTVTGRSYKRNPDNHVVAQKIIYLLTALGMGIGDYRYVWGENGPYSLRVKAQLESEASDKEDIDENVRIESELSKYGLSILEKMDMILAAARENNREEKDWLGLISSIHFVGETEVFAPSRNKPEVFKRLKERKKQRFERKDDDPLAWNEKLFNKAWSVMENAGLL